MRKENPLNSDHSITILYNGIGGSTEHDNQSFLDPLLLILHVRGNRTEADNLDRLEVKSGS